MVPQLKMWHLSKKYSGIDWAMLYKVRHAARRRLWGFVGLGTIVIVHGGHQDFLSIRWMHHKVIDNLNYDNRLERTAQFGQPRQGPPGPKKSTGKNGLDSLEDAQATRDLAHWYVKNLSARVGVGVNGLVDW